MSSDRSLFIWEQKQLFFSSFLSPEHNHCLRSICKNNGLYFVSATFYSTKSGNLFHSLCPVHRSGLFPTTVVSCDLVNGSESQVIISFSVYRFANTFLHYSGVIYYYGMSNHSGVWWYFNKEHMALKIPYNKVILSSFPENLYTYDNNKKVLNCLNNIQ